MRMMHLKVAGLMALAGLAAAPRALAADHLDGAAVKGDASTDITDIFAWMTSDGTKVNLVLNVSPIATTSSNFSNVAKYVFHTSSCAAYTAPAACTTAHEDIICTFDTSSPQKVSCWVGTDAYVTGDASAVAGLSSTDGKVKVFTGLRDDPFFFNLAGFNAVRADVTAGKGGFSYDAAGCPALSAAISTALVTALSTDPTSSPPGGPAKDFFAGLNVLSIVLQVDKSLLTKGGPVVGVWASTNK
jgi:hypothetical protein